MQEQDIYELPEETIAQLITKVHAMASSIRGDWTDPRTECREIHRLCDKITKLATNPVPIPADEPLAELAERKGRVYFAIHNVIRGNETEDIYFTSDNDARRFLMALPDKE